MELTQISSQYEVRKITKKDISKLYHLCKENTLYYEHMKTEPAIENLTETMTMLPPGKEQDDKYFAGYFKGEELVGVLDLIADYPEKNTAYIGWFITDVKYQSAGVGTAAIRELLAFLKENGFKEVQLGYIKGNPQAEHFWKKNGFEPTGGETKTETYTIIKMRKLL